MDKKPRRLLLHRAIKMNDFRRFKSILSVNKASVNKQNKLGQTPLLMCLDYDRPTIFIEQLLIRGADIMKANKDGIAPITVAMTKENASNLIKTFHGTFAQLIMPELDEWDPPDTFIPFDTGLAQLMLNYTANKHLRNTTNFSEKILQSFRNGKWKCKLFVIERGSNTGKVLVCGMTTPYVLTIEDIDIRSLDTFTKQIQTDKSLKKQELNLVYVDLIKESITLPTSKTFKTVWPKANHRFIARKLPSFIYTYLATCKFKNAKFIKGLNLILTSRHASSFINSSSKPFIRELIATFSRRKIKQRQRLSVLLHSVKLVKYTIDDIMKAYRVFGFNEEVVLLMMSYNKVEHNWYNRIFYFVTTVESNTQLSSEVLDNLELIPKTVYRNLINSLPPGRWDDDEIIQRRKNLLNEIPKLSDLSKYAFQKYVQEFYNVQTPGKFIKIVQASILPEAIKNSLCHKPPVYY